MQVRDPDVRRHGDLELTDDIEAQRHLWRRQRVIRALGVVVLVLALLGVLGDGPLARRTATVGPVTLHYESVGYRGSAQSYRLTLPSPPRGERVAIWLDREAVARMSIQQIVPTPVASSVEGDRVVYVIATDASAQPVEIAVRFQPEEAGFVRIRLGVQGGETLTFAQLVLP